MSIGDLHSTEPGSAARFNTGKPPLDLLPLRAIARTYRLQPFPVAVDVPGALDALGAWQFRSVEGSYWLNVAFARLGRPIAGAARVFDYGRGKYAAWNWAKGMPWSVVTASCARHMVAHIEAAPDSEELNDAESGLPHLWHAACNLLMLLHYETHYTLGDDRPGAPS